MSPDHFPAFHESLELDQGVYLDNSGLILLWPFLERFLGTLELVQNGAFRARELQERAVLLLQHLVTGESKWPEHRLLLNKLLCAWPLDEPVVRSIALSSRERHEANELLVSVIEHWSALKRTSVDGLRASFLQREGRLKREAGMWQLKVARVGYDVLLDHLPWGIGVVKLPWMIDAVMVEW